MSDMTPRQSEILSFIRSTLEQRGYAPSNREICTRFGFRSPNAVSQHLKALREKGLVTWEPYGKRTLRLTEPSRLERAERLLRKVLENGTETLEEIREYFGQERPTSVS